MSSFFISFLDQMFVSGGSFLTLLLSAHSLSMDQQGKLSYIVSVYMVATLLNNAVLFSVAPVLKKSLSKFLHAFYRQQLFFIQLALSISLSFAVCFSLYLGQTIIQWQMSAGDLVSIFSFLFLQQIVDFFRRSYYIFEGSRYSVFSSVLVYGSRVLLIFVLFPREISTIFWILIFSSCLGFIPLTYIYRRDLFKFHLRGFNRRTLGPHFSLAKWSIFSAPLVWFSFFFPGFILGCIESPSSVAVYFSLKSLSGAANIFLEILETRIPNWLASYDTNKNLRVKTTKLVCVGMFFWLIVMILIVSLGDTVIEVSLGSNYKKYGNMMIFFWLGNGVHFVARVLGLHYRMKSHTYFEFLSALGGAAGFIISVPFILKMGIFGATLASVFVPLGFLIFQLIFIYKTNLFHPVFSERVNK